MSDNLTSEFVEKRLNAGLHSDICYTVSARLGMFSLYNSISFGLSMLTFVQGTGA